MIESCLLTAIFMITLLSYHTEQATQSASYLIIPRHQHQSSETWSNAEMADTECMLWAVIHRAPGFTLWTKSDGDELIGFCLLIKTVDLNAIMSTNGYTLFISKLFMCIFQNK